MTKPKLEVYTDKRGRRRISIAKADRNWSAKAGQTIVGRLTRGNDGKFTGGPVSEESPKDKAKREKAEKKAQAERETRDKTLAGAGLDENVAGALVEFASEEGLELTEANRDKLAALGLIDVFEDGSAALSSNGKALMNAAKSGNARGAQDALTRGKDAAAKKAEKAAAEKTKADEKAAKEAEKKAKEAEKAKGGGGGGGGGEKKPTEAEEAAAKAKEAADNRKATARATGVKERDADTLARLADGSAADESEVDGLAEQGLVRATGDNQFEPTPAGRKYLAAVERGDTRAAHAALQDAKNAGIKDKEKAAAAAERKTQQEAKAQERAAAAAARAEKQAQAEAARAARQAASDARRAEMDARRKAREDDMARRRAEADARQRARFEAWQAKQTPKPAPDSKPTPSAPASMPATPRPKPTPGSNPALPLNRTKRQTVGGGNRTTMPIDTKADSPDLLKRDRRDPLEPWHGFAVIQKVDQDQRIVEGIAISEAPDQQGGMWDGQRYAGDVVPMDTIQAALPDYLEWANLREMHQPSAVGKVLSATVENGALRIVAQIVDDAAWEKVRAGVYKGFSIGGRCLAAAIVKSGSEVFRKITKMVLSEISLVDRPANPEARIELWKGYGMNPDEQPAGEVQDDTLHKAAAGDPMKAIQLLQALRDAAELEGQTEQARGYSLAIEAALEAAGVAQGDGADPEQDGEPVEMMDEPAADETMEEADAADMIVMAERIGDIAKAGKSLSNANMQQLQAIHDACVKMSGGAVCGTQEPAPAATAPSPAGDVAMGAGIAPGAPAKKNAPMVKADTSEDIQKSITAATAPLLDTIEKLNTRLAALESQPAPGGPVLRAVDKNLQTQTPEPTIAKRAPRAVDISELRRLSIVEPNPALRADYARQLTEAEAAQA